MSTRSCRQCDNFFDICHHRKVYRHISHEQRCAQWCSASSDRNTAHGQTQLSVESLPELKILHGATMKLDARGPGGLWRTCSAVCGLTGGSGVDSDVMERGLA